MLLNFKFLADWEQSDIENRRMLTKTITEKIAKEPVMIIKYVIKH